MPIHETKCRQFKHVRYGIRHSSVELMKSKGKVEKMHCVTLQLSDWWRNTKMT